MAISRSGLSIDAAPPGILAGRPSWKKKIDNIFLIGIPMAGSLACPFWFHDHPIHWVEVVTFVIGYFVIGMGTGVGFHRYFSHKSFQTEPWVAYALGAAGSMSFQSSVLTWVSDHRRHHAHTDNCGDNHSPYVDEYCGASTSLKGLFHAHIGWMFDSTATDLKIYARDLVKDPVIRFYTRTHYVWPAVSLAIPWLIGYAFGGIADAWGCVLAACLRTLLFQHSVWAVNSFGHTFGYENYSMKNNSKNNTLLAWLTFGDGYHNNHHRYPRSAFHGLRKGEVDMNGVIIILLCKVGLASRIIIPDEYAELKKKLAV